ncbi:hypothetical protein THAOC_11200 [Thalassiosira oceanica]|uniref:Uncharacterized protein n=1 Tax=Thalassiosira oceanica TaxID=159749 RepID=K0SQV2_THAOC|nr:hypothetical protein THAOC_11200 [Thalassiosira oceanica]|eukprot:EJK67735.1 hypothetical protein THAOC_11200 [Thalassiosira oceanica]
MFIPGDKEEQDMWPLNIMRAEPNHDKDLHRLLDLRPWNQDERRQYDDAKVRCQIKRNPGAVAVRYSFRYRRGHTTRCSPIFRVVALGGSLKTVRACHISDRRRRVARTNEQKNTLLHVACTFRQTAEVVRWIYARDPGAVEAQNRHGLLPLHCAAARGSSAEVVRLLIGWSPEALHSKNILRETPYDAAKHAGASHEVLKLVDPNVNAVSQTFTRRISESLASLTSCWGGVEARNEGGVAPTRRCSL